MKLAADVASLEAYFGVPAKFAYGEVDPYQNCLTFETEIGQDRIWFELIPFRDHAQLRWVGSPFRVFNLSFSNIKYLGIRKTKEDHRMLIQFSDVSLSDFKMWLRPHILTFWGNAGVHDDDESPLEAA